MATRFEIALHGTDLVALRAAGEEALDEVERLEGQLSLYRPTSEIAQLNARAAREPVRVSPSLFALLERAGRLHQETDGAFDITIGPLMRCWGFMGGTGQVPPPDDLAAARAKVGMRLVELNARDCTVHFTREGVMLDLGAIGKGYAVERAADVLREAGVTSALLHGGTSTIYALGHPPDAEAWKVAVERPSDSPETSPALLAVVALADIALSVSAVWGKSFQTQDKLYGHVLDPRTGQPVSQALLAAIAASSATDTDALSTALLTLGAAGLDQITALRPGARALVLDQGAGTGDYRVETRGIVAGPLTRPDVLRSGSSVS
jgi:thiamine biosynthesis lipoprotein